jgi:hypothetical protein
MTLVAQDEYCNKAFDVTRRGGGYGQTLNLALTC